MDTTAAPPPVLAVHLWQVPARDVARAVTRLATGRLRLRGSGAGERPQFAKWLGTGSGRTFSARDVDLRHWAVLTCWPDRAAAERFDDHPAVRSWDRGCQERFRLLAAPVSAQGRWSRRTPFGSPAPRPVAGPVAALTRARLRPRQAVAFWRSVPPVSADLHATPGLLAAIGVGEAPIGLQGTLSLWESSAALTAFAYRGAAHTQAIADTHRRDWYAEELFARFEILAAEGRWHGADPLAGCRALLPAP